jgi:hypothetical protein
MANHMEFETKKPMSISLSYGCNPFEEFVLFNVAGIVAEIHLPDLAAI